MFAEIGEKLIADDSVHGFETFSGGCLLILRGGGVWARGKRGNDGSGGCSDWSHWEETIVERLTVAFK